MFINRSSDWSFDAHSMSYIRLLMQHRSTHWLTHSLIYCESCLVLFLTEVNEVTIGSYMIIFFQSSDIHINTMKIHTLLFVCVCVATPSLCVCVCVCVRVCVSHILLVANHKPQSSLPYHAIIRVTPSLIGCYCCCYCCCCCCYYRSYGRYIGKRVHIQAPKLSTMLR